MALREKHLQALTLRKQGLPYSVIKLKLGVSKSTLSYWLRDMPLELDRINELRAKSPKRIERFRDTMRVKREKRLDGVCNQVKKDIGKLTKREFLIAGFFLYWGEGGKTQRYSISLSNTDPSMIRFYLKWLGVLGVPLSKITVRLHLYSDMDIKRETNFWMKESGLLSEQFKKPYIKQSQYLYVSELGFGHGTCNIIVNDRDTTEYVLESLKVIVRMC